MLYYQTKVELGMCTTGGQPISPEQFKEQQRQMWDNVAMGWQSWWQTFERGAQKVSDMIVEMAEIKPGDKVLDIATGIGEPAITAARKVKPNGKVVATDISAQMLAIARARARSLGLDNVMEFKETDAENLNLNIPESTKFDAILSRWGLMFLPNLRASLLKFKDRMVAGGRISTAVWSTPAKVPLLDVSFSTVRKELNLPPPPPGTIGPFALADSESLKRSFIDAGFKDIRMKTMMATFSFDSPGSYTKFNQDIVAPIHVMLAKETEERKMQVWNLVTDAALDYADSHGRVSMDNEVIFIVGKN